MTISTVLSNSGKCLDVLAHIFFSDIVILDNHHKDNSTDFPDRVISARMIVEEFGGNEAIAQALYTNLKVSFILMS